MVWSIACLAVMACVAGTAYAQTDTVPGYVVYVPDVMIRGESYHGVIVSDMPANKPVTFRFGSGLGDVALPYNTTIPAGQNHAVFAVAPIAAPVLSGVIKTQITVIYPDDEPASIPITTYPGAGAVSRLWVVGPGADGVSCDGPSDTSAAAIADMAGEGTFVEANPTKEIRTRLPDTTIHVFLADRYCTPSPAPPGGVRFEVSANTPALTFGDGRTHIAGVIPESYNAAVVDVAVSGDGTIYATGDGVTPDSIAITRVPPDTEVRLGVGPTNVAESSYVEWFVWLERDGRQYVPPAPVPVYLTTNNPVLASFDQRTVGSGGPLFADVRPHHAYVVNGAASGVIYAGTPGGSGDLRLLATSRDVTVTAHVPGYGSATAGFVIGGPNSMPSDTKFILQTDQLERCMAAEDITPDGFYSEACNEMWRRILVSSHFYDITTPDGRPLDSPEATIAFLDRMFGGDNDEGGRALYDLMARVNEYSLRDNYTGGMAWHLQELLATYLRSADITLEPVRRTVALSDMLDRLPDAPPPNKLTLDAFPGPPGTYHVVISTRYVGGEFDVPVYVPDGTITLTGDGDLIHEPYITTYGSAPRPHAPGTRPSAVTIPVSVYGDGVITASLGGVGSATATIPDMAGYGGKSLHVSTMPGSGQRDIIAIVSVLDEDGALTSHSGDVHVTAGYGASDVELVGWRGGGGIIRGTIHGVGEIIIHAPGMGGGTATTAPVRHERSLDVWHPDAVHVAETFPVSAHTLDVDGRPIHKVDVDVGGAVNVTGGGPALLAAGEADIIAEYDGMFDAITMSGFVNSAEVSARLSSDVVELNDVVAVYVDTGAMPDPTIHLSGGDLLFSREGDRWAALAGQAGSHDIGVVVEQPGWETHQESLRVVVSQLFDVEFHAATSRGVLVAADLAICEDVVPAGAHARMAPGVCRVSVPSDIRVDGVAHRLASLDINGQPIQSGAAYDFGGAAKIRATYEGVVIVDVTGEFPDGTMREMSYARYAPGDAVSVAAEPEYAWWGLVWDRPDRWSGLPRDAVIRDGVAMWEAAGDVSVVVSYARDITYLVMVGAAGLTAPVWYMVRHRIPGLRFK